MNFSIRIYSLIKQHPQKKINVKAMNNTHSKENEKWFLNKQLTMIFQIYKTRSKIR